MIINNQNGSLNMIMLALLPLLSGSLLLTLKYKRSKLTQLKSANQAYLCTRKLNYSLQEYSKKMVSLNLKIKKLSIAYHSALAASLANPALLKVAKASKKIRSGLITYQRVTHISFLKNAYSKLIPRCKFLIFPSISHFSKGPTLKRNKWKQAKVIFKKIHYGVRKHVTIKGRSTMALNEIRIQNSQTL